MNATKSNYRRNHDSNRPINSTFTNGEEFIVASHHARYVQSSRLTFGDEISQQLALKIALHMGNDNSPAELAIGTLAAAVPCHYNTADKRLKKLADSGLIRITKGSGKLLRYMIPGDWDDEITPPTTPPTVDHSEDIDRLNGRIDALESKIDALVKIVERLSHDLHTIVTPSSHDLHTTFTPSVNENVNKEEKKRRREEEEKRSPPTPPPAEKEWDGPPTPAAQEFPFRNNGRNVDPTPADERRDAILEVCGLDATVPAHVRQADNAAAQLKNYTAEYIRGRYGPGGWWYLDHWRGQKGQQPEPMQLVSTISKTTHTAANGEGQSFDELFSGITLEANDYGF